MRQFTFLFLIGFLITLISCRTDFETVASTGDLKFSTDTVYLDTIFTNIGSSTYTLKVYNNSKNDITIPTIQLKRGLNSKFRMTVDGMQGNQGKIFNNVNLLAKDSLYIFIETTFKKDDIEDMTLTEFLYIDQILFDGGKNLQKVGLVTLVKDAIFLYPQRFDDQTTETLTIDEEKIYGFSLEDNELNFTNNKPYVIYGYAGVPKGKTAIFDAGARVHFHANSGLILMSEASLKVNGETSTTDKLEKEVIFEGDRLEPDFSDIPGQWGYIWLKNGSKNHEINHLTIKNATVGLRIDDNDETTAVEIKNTQIYNSANYGILAQTAKINGENLVINNAGLGSLACTYGGNYKFQHCTFNNNWDSSSQVAVLVSNYKLGATPEVKHLTAATFNNCIIYGSYSNELILNKKMEADFAYQFNNCLIKFDNSPSQYTNHPEYQFTDPVHYNSIIQNQNPKFLNVAKNKLNIDNTSAAFQKGNENYYIPLDILGNTRTSPPDLGAYQNKAFP